MRNLCLAFLSAKEPIEVLSELEKPGLEILGSLPDWHWLESPRTANKGGYNFGVSKPEDPVSGAPLLTNSSDSFTNFFYKMNFFMDITLELT